jgi:hypothetical protein
MMIQINEAVHNRLEFSKTPLLSGNAVFASFVLVHACTQTQDELGVQT